ncbi:hypothetical protein VM98_37325, partial [Streptomyces rubellomurinus subsp. indigoferus]
AGGAEEGERRAGRTAGEGEGRPGGGGPAGAARAGAGVGARAAEDGGGGPPAQAGAGEGGEEGVHGGVQIGDAAIAATGRRPPQPSSDARPAAPDAPEPSAQREPRERS